MIQGAIIIEHLHTILAWKLIILGWRVGTPASTYINMCILHRTFNLSYHCYL